MTLRYPQSSQRCSRSSNSISLATCRVGWALEKTRGQHRRITTLASSNSLWNAAGGRRIGTGLPAAGTTTVERRAADVAVLGSSCVAVAAAYSLARRGKKVVLLPDLGLAAARPPVEAYRPLQLTHPDGAMVSMVSEAAAYWRGLQAQAGDSGLQLLADCRSLDLGAVRGGGEAGEMLGRMQDGCKAAGVRLGSLRSEELSGLFPALQLPAGVSGLIQPEGGVLNSLAAHKLLLSLGERHGLLVRDRLVLRGWRDKGSHFVLRASGALLPEAESVFEVEQLLLAPEVWPRAVLRMFGVDATLQAVQGTFGRCAATAELASTPLWRAIGIPIGGTTGPVGVGSPERPDQLQVVTGLPARRAALGSSPCLKLSLGLVDPRGAAATVPGDWQPGNPDRLGLQWAHRLAGRLLRGVGPPLLPPALLDSVALPAAEGALGRDLDSLPAQQVLERWGDAGLHTATPDGWPVLGFLPGLEPGRLLFASTASAGFTPDDAASAAGPGSSFPRAAADASAAPGSAARPTSAPGMPEPGRPRGGGASAGAGSQSSQPQPPQPLGTPDVAGHPSSAWLLGGRQVLSDGYQLSPLLAKMAVDLLCGAARPQEADPERLELSRAALGARTRAEGLDPWDGLARWQDGTALRAEAAAARGEGADEAEARERAEALAKGARMAGADLGPEEEAAREEEERRRGSGPKVLLINRTPSG